MAGNTTTKKQYGGVASGVVDKTNSSRTVNASNSGPVSKGQLEGNRQSFANPMNEVNAKIGGLSGTHNDIGELSGFITDGYLANQGTHYGESAKFN